MIRDARVLRAGFTPREVEHRDAEVNHLSSVLEPITNGEPADTAMLTGPSGAGKTCISKLVTERLREEVLDIKTTYVNCRRVTWTRSIQRFSLSRGALTVKWSNSCAGLYTNTKEGMRVERK
jgi:Cdc6-like AAA superfamily ATPase